MTRTTFGHPDELTEEIGNELSYGDSKSEWIRLSIRMRQYIDLILDEIFESYQRVERLELVGKTVRDKVDELKRENGNSRNGD